MPVPSFDIFNLPRIAIGPGKIASLTDFAREIGRHVLVVYNGGDKVKARVAGLLEQAGSKVVFHRQKGEPTVADVDAGLAVGRSSNCTGVVGVGGGSAIDAAKAIAGLLSNGGSALDYMEVIGAGKRITTAALPWIAIPTTAGTGAEVTRNAVIGEPSRQFKASIRSELLLPKVAIIDAELGLDVPPDVTAASGMDALCQCIEAYLSNGANPITDALALQGIDLAAGALEGAYRNGHDIQARHDMATAALLGGICLTNAGLGAVHGFAAPIGANFPVPHGVVCGVLLPHVLRANTFAARRSSAHADTLRRIAKIGNVIVGAHDLREKEQIEHLMIFLEGLADVVPLPRLKDFGMTRKAVKPMVKLAKKASSMKFNPVVLDDDELEFILKRAIG